MENIKAKDFLKTLKCVDIDTGHISCEAIEWIFDLNVEIKHMLFWLCTYIDENNVETGYELYEYNYLRKKGMILSGNKFDNKVREIDGTHPGIFNINSTEITTLEKQLESESSKEKTLEKLTSNYLALDYKIVQQLAKLENQEISMQVEKEAALNNCLSKSKEIDETHAQIQANMRKYSDILLNYSQLGTEKYFLSQMPLNGYRQEDENFKTYLNLWIEKDFSVDEITRSIKTTRTKHKLEPESYIIGKEFERIYNNIQESIINRIKAECSEIEMETRLEYFENNYNMKLYETDNRVKTIQLSSRINSLREDYNRLCVMQLQEVTEKFTQNLIDSVLCSYAKMKLEKCREMYKKLECLNYEVKRALAEKCLMAMLLKTEKFKLESMVKFLSSSHFFLTKQDSENTQRHRTMNGVQNAYLSYKKTSIKERDELINDFLLFVTDNFKNESVTIKSTLAKTQETKSRIETLQHDLFVENFQRHANVVKDVENKLKEIKQIIWHGPTMQPVIIPYSFTENMFDAQFNREKVSNELNRCMQLYKKTENTLSQNKWLRNKCLLYVWFLTEPKKIINAINQIEAFVANKHKSNTLDER